jgi:hypothetical protein
MPRRIAHKSALSRYELELRAPGVIARVSGADVRYICDTCRFSDKIREVFVQSKMEIV